MTNASQKPKRRIRSPHPGVKIVRKIRSDGLYTWYARFEDPNTGRITQTNLTVLGKTTVKSRRTWAIQKAKSLAYRIAEAEATGVVRTETILKKAIEVYFKDRSSELKASTLAAYKQATVPFAAWCADNGISLTESLNSQKLAAFRQFFLVRPAHSTAKGEKTGRGARRTGTRRRAPAQINKCLRALRTVVGHWRRLGTTPLLDSDDIRDSLQFLRLTKPLPKFLKIAEIRQLLESAIKHDTVKFTLTRQEHVANVQTGMTHKYTSISPFVVLALLSGMRFSELAGLRWRDVDLEAGEITLSHEATKTGQGRRITLKETPALKSLLDAMKPKKTEPSFLWGSAPFRRDLAEATRKRLTKKFGAPVFRWHDLRRTAGTFLTCAPGIYGGASAYMSAKRAGHSVVVSERHYVGALTLASDATSLEAAMGADDLIQKVIALVAAAV